MPSAVCVCVCVCDRPQYNNGAAMQLAATVAAAIYRSTLSAAQSVASSINSLHVECEDVWPVRGPGRPSSSSHV